MFNFKYFFNLCVNTSWFVTHCGLAIVKSTLFLSWGHRKAMHNHNASLHKGFEIHGKFDPRLGKNIGWFFHYEACFMHLKENLGQWLVHLTTLLLVKYWIWFSKTPQLVDYRWMKQILCTRLPAKFTLILYFQQCCNGEFFRTNSN